MIERYFDTINYDSYPQNSDFNYLPIEYKQRLFTERSIYRLTDNSVDRLQVSLIEKYFDNLIYESNTQNANFDDLPFVGGERLIAR